MKHTEKIAPVAAAFSALATLACCLPIAVAAGTATATVAMIAGAYRSWFFAGSVVLLLIGVVQVVSERRRCPTRRPGSLVILGASGAVVVLVLLFPQVIAGLIADWMP